MHSLGLDGMTVQFFQTYWHIVGEDVTLVMLGCLFFLFSFFLFWDEVLGCLMTYLEIKKRRGSKVKGGKVIQLPYLEVF